VTVAVNAAYKEGRASSIRAGLARLDPRATAVLILGVDQPRPGRLISRVVRAHLEGEALITMPSYEGRGGHPVIFSTKLLPELLAITEEGQGLREVLAGHPKETQRVDVKSPIAVLDLNTPDEYRRALGIFENDVLPGSR
jgi:molybdenum cofactor cytidylyltransferase